jgi:hypothetical protein
MKKLILKTLLMSVLLGALVVSCDKDDKTVANPVLPVTETNYGTFGGNFQVADDPQTNLGYVFNATAAISSVGNTATIKIKGNDGFDREYTATVGLGSTPSTTLFNLTNQTKPVNKTAGGAVIIQNNSATIDVTLANDAVVVRSTTSSTTSFTVSGKLSIIGTSLLKI